MRFGRGGALHVSWILSEFFCIIWSNIVHVISHCSLVNWFCFKMFVSSFNCGAFSSKNSVLNFRYLCVGWDLGSLAVCLWLVVDLGLVVCLAVCVVLLGSGPN